MSECSFISTMQSLFTCNHDGKLANRTLKLFCEVKLFLNLLLRLTRVSAGRHHSFLPTTIHRTSICGGCLLRVFVRC